VLGELHARLAGLYLAQGDHAEAAASAEEALAHPHLGAGARRVMEGMLVLCTVARAGAA
jgi:hypothetical protein